MAWLHLKENLKMNDWENLFAGKHWRKTYLRKIVARFAFCIKSLCTKSISVLGARCDWMKIKRGLVFVAFLQSSNVIPGNSCCHLHWGWFFQRLIIQISAWKITKCIQWFHLMLTTYSPLCRFLILITLRNWIFTSRFINIYIYIYKVTQKAYEKKMKIKMNRRAPRRMKKKMKISRM